MTKFPDFFAALAAPFSSQDVRSFTKGGRMIRYVTPRTIQNRLDEVAGPEGWWCDFSPIENGVLCRLTLVLPDGRQVTKADAGGSAGMSDQGDDEKSAHSDSLKRAACMWGVGRYLWGSGVPDFVRERHGDAAPAGAGRAGSNDDDYARAEREAMRQEAGSIGRSAPHAPAPARSHGGANGHGGGAGNFDGKPPRTGRALYGWAKDVEQEHDLGMVRYLSEWGKLQTYPERMLDWGPEQVARAYEEGSRKLAAVLGAATDLVDEALSN